MITKTINPSELIDLSTVLVGYMGRLLKERRLRDDIKRQLKACLDEFEESASELEKQVSRLKELLTVDRTYRRRGRKYYLEPIRKCFERLAEAFKCALEVLAGNVDELEILAHMKPEKYRIVLLMARIYKEENVLDIGKLYRARPADFKEGFSQFLKKDFMPEFRSIFKDKMIKWDRYRRRIFEGIINIARDTMGRIVRVDKETGDKIVRLIAKCISEEL